MIRTISSGYALEIILGIFSEIPQENPPENYKEFVLGNLPGIISEISSTFYFSNLTINYFRKFSRYLITNSYKVIFKSIGNSFGNSSYGFCTP